MLWRMAITHDDLPLAPADLNVFTFHDAAVALWHTRHHALVIVRSATELL